MGDITRRGFLASACALVAVGAAAGPASAATGVTTLPDGRLAVTVRKVPQLARPGGAVRVGAVDGVPVAVARTGARSYVAFSLACPHQGVTVRGGTQGWSCPAHGPSSRRTANW